MTSYLDLSAIVHDKESAIKFLQEKELLPTERNCCCGKKMKLPLSDKRDRFRCTDKKCAKEVSLKKDTWFEACHLSYHMMILFIFWWSHESTTLKFCKVHLKIASDHTIVDHNNFLREVCAWRLLEEPNVIGGPGKTVEIDETLVSRRKYNVGRLKKQTWVFGGICREDKQCFLYVVPDRTQEMLESCIRASVRPGTTIISDCWRSYNGIETMGLEYRHLTVNHSKNFVDPTSGACTNRVESMWNVAKMKFKKMWGVSEPMVDSYLCEFMYRKRYANSNLFDRILHDIACYQNSLLRENLNDPSVDIS
ncbi:unnamed protein product [Auanema sp. JU1783]|nr:unnamed protein product [Auanema sp. JU1783]